MHLVTHTMHNTKLIRMNIKFLFHIAMWLSGTVRLDSSVYKWCNLTLWHTRSPACALSHAHSLLNRIDDCEKVIRWKLFVSFISDSMHKHFITKCQDYRQRLGGRPTLNTMYDYAEPTISFLVHNFSCLCAWSLAKVYLKSINIATVRSRCRHRCCRVRGLIASKPRQLTNLCCFNEFD